MIAAPLTPAQRMAASLPKWQTEDYVDPLSLIRRNQAPPARRSYPPAQNSSPGRMPLVAKNVKLKSVGGGYEVYLEPEDGAEPGSDEAKHRFRSVKPTGDGISILIEAAEEAEELEFKGIKAGDDTPITVEDDGEAIVVKGNNVTATARINNGGTITTRDGLIESLSEGVLGGTGSLGYLPCNETQAVPLINWVEGQLMTNGDVSFLVGSCHTDAPGA